LEAENKGHFPEGLATQIMQIKNSIFFWLLLYL